MSEKKHLTVLVVPHDERNVRRLRLSYRWLKTLAAIGCAVGILVIVAALTYGRMAAQATRAAMLERENDRLSEENAKVEAIAENLARTEAAYQQIREMAGLSEADGGASLDAPDPGDPPAAADRSAVPSAAGTPPEGPGIPGGWPLTIKGFVTARFTGENGHPGFDIAAPVNTPVVATASGTVERAGTDPVYGEYLLLHHEEGFSTLYGHNALLLVDEGDRVERGETIAYSGNSGRSTAPHLHYEVRREGRAIDPQAYLQ